MFIFSISYAEKIMHIKNNVDNIRTTSHKHSSDSISSVLKPLVHSLNSATSKTDKWLNRKMDSAEDKVQKTSVEVKKIMFAEKFKLAKLIKKMVNEAIKFENITIDKT